MYCNKHADFLPHRIWRLGTENMWAWTCQPSTGIHSPLGIINTETSQLCALPVLPRIAKFPRRADHINATRSHLGPP